MPSFSSSTAATAAEICKQPDTYVAAVREPGRWLTLNKCWKLLCERLCTQAAQ